jgi:hypothetical protein
MRRTEITGENIKSVIVTLYGFDEYARTYIAEYDSLFKEVMSQIVNLKRKDADEIARELGKPSIFVGHILRILKGEGLVVLAETHSGKIRILDISAELKRRLLS